MNPIKRTSVIVGLLACTYGCLPTTGATNMTPQRPSGSQDPALPHPGTITAKFDWNGSTELWKASDFPDSFIFRCFDKDGKRTQRANAAWCVPVVEVETVSIDENGKPVAPSEADTISNTIYGPGHTFLEHTSSQPSPKRQRELPRPRSSTPDGSSAPSQNELRARTPEPPLSFEFRGSKYENSGGVGTDNKKLGWWAKIKAWFRFA